MVRREGAGKSLKIGQVCARLGVSPNTAKGLIRRGELPGYLVGSQHHVDSDDLEAYIARQKGLAVARRAAESGAGGATGDVPVGDERVSSGLAALHAGGGR